MPTPLTPASALWLWLQQAPRHVPYVLDVLDILTVYGGVAVQRQEWQRAIEVLTPLYAMSAQPQQAYYLARGVTMPAASRQPLGWKPCVIVSRRCSMRRRRSKMPQH